MKLDGVQLVAQELFDKHKKLTASMLIKAASDKNSPAHNAFEWNNTKAANEYRLWQARQYIKKITITYENQEEKLFHVPVKIKSENNKEGEYKPISIMEQDEFDRALSFAKQQLLKCFDNVKTMQNYLNNDYKRKGAKNKINSAYNEIKKAVLSLESI